MAIGIVELATYFGAKQAVAIIGLGMVRWELDLSTMQDGS